MLASVCKKWLFQVHTSDCLDNKKKSMYQEREGFLLVSHWSVCQWFVLGLVLCWLPPAPYINAVRGVEYPSVQFLLPYWGTGNINSEKYDESESHSYS